MDNSAVHVEMSRREVQCQSLGPHVGTHHKKSEWRCTASSLPSFAPNLCFWTCLQQTAPRFCTIVPLHFAAKSVFPCLFSPQSAPSPTPVAQGTANFHDGRARPLGRLSCAQLEAVGFICGKASPCFFTSATSQGISSWLSTETTTFAAEQEDLKNAHKALERRILLKMIGTVGGDS